MAAYKILLADDSVTVRKVIELTFADEGFDVASVADGDAAMKKFVEFEPDMVIADVNMPGMSGYQICEMIKQDETTRHIPVILLVGSFEPFDPGEASRVGSNYYFTKPFQSIRELVEKVTEYLELGAAPDNGEPETADIDHLYSESFQNTLEMPTVDDLNSELDARSEQPEIKEEPWLEAEAAQSGIDTEHSQPAEIVSGEGETSRPETEEFHTPVVSPQELGDAGMDDEIIETSHPGRIDELELALTAPFDVRADETRKDTSMAKFNWSGDAVEIIEEIKTLPGKASLLESNIEDIEPTPVVASEEAHFTPPNEANIDIHADKQPTVSPELIEMIVRSVLEKMSDRAVRDVAQEAVPRIAEKLIREALDEEKKNK